MKKLFIALILMLILIGNINNNEKFSLLNYFSGEYTVYTSKEVEGSTNLGFCYMAESAELPYVIGESIKVNNFEPISALKCLNAELIKTEILQDGTTVFYAYTDLILDKVTIDNEFVNLQIACVDDYCVIGWPLILGSF